MEIDIHMKCTSPKESYLTAMYISVMTDMFVERFERLQLSGRLLEV